MKYKGVDNIAINICPFKYYPSIDSLSVLFDFVLNVRFKQKDNFVNAKDETIFDKGSELLFDNITASNNISVAVILQ